MRVSILMGYEVCDALDTKQVILMIRTKENKSKIRKGY